MIREVAFGAVLLFLSALEERKKNAQKSRRVFCSIYRKVNVKYVTSFESALSSLGPFSGIWVRYSGETLVVRCDAAADRGRARLALRLYATRVF